MSKRSKEMALKAYPKRKDGRLRGYSCTDEDIRKTYTKGYRKAEKDTIERAWEWMTTAKGECTFDDFRKAMEE